MTSPQPQVADNKISFDTVLTDFIPVCKQEIGGWGEGGSVPQPYKN